MYEIMSEDILLRYHWSNMIQLGILFPEEIFFMRDFMLKLTLCNLKSFFNIEPEDLTPCLSHRRATSILRRKATFGDFAARTVFLSDGELQRNRKTENGKRYSHGLTKDISLNQFLMGVTSVPWMNFFYWCSSQSPPWWIFQVMSARTKHNRWALHWRY